jgi:hypothetical protein
MYDHLGLRVGISVKGAFLRRGVKNLPANSYRTTNQREPGVQELTRPVAGGG